ncbi:hypothetical protein L1887_21356 [Cichorium endivia]|nr:hypothetical protein L1887_21356 [Cichorium endivia]
MAPLTSVILGSVLVYLTHAEKHGVQVVGELKKGLNPITIMHLSFGSQYLSTAIKTGIITGIIALAVALSLLRVLLFVARPRTSALGHIPDSTIYRSIDQYQSAKTVPGILILQIDAPIYFANSSYLRERILRWVNEEEDRLKSIRKNSLKYVVLALSAVGNIDTSGITMLREIKKVMERRGIKLVLANPGGEVIKKMNKAKLIDVIGQKWIYLTVGEAVEACNFMLHTDKNVEDSTSSGSSSGKETQNDNNV